MAEKLENTTELQGKSIPVDVIEAILSKLPVKSLIRFKLLSKLCKAIIFDPFFSKLNYNHLSKSHNLFLTEMDSERFCLMRLEDGSIFHTEAELGDPFGPHAIPLCSCNGIILILPMCRRWDEFFLWNPSIQRYTVIQSPAEPDSCLINAGLYHDSRTDDYKVVIISSKCITMVYSCKTRTWTEEELIPSTICGVHVDGYFYWQKEPYHEEIWCFDFRERKMDKLKLPEKMPDKMPGQLRLDTFWGCLLTRLWGRLCLHPLDTEDHVWARENDGWRDFINMLKTGVHFCHTMTPVLINRNAATDVRYFSSFVKYNDCQKRFEKVELSSFVIYNDGEKRFEKFEIPDVRYPKILLQYAESLFFPFEVERM